MHPDSLDMPEGDPWDTVRRELDNWQRDGRTARLWLRDDDAITPTAALDQLLGICRSREVPLLLCVIPMRADQRLVAHLAHRPLVKLAVHGAWHRNHGRPNTKSEEMAIERGRAVVLQELTAARARLIHLFGQHAGDWYVPPWNRISDEAAALLQRVGFSALSTFAAKRHNCPGLSEHNTHVDLINWRGGRVGRSPAWISEQLAQELAKARVAGHSPVGILTHHLDHDATAWMVLTGLIEVTSRHPAASWIRPSDLLTMA